MKEIIDLRRTNKSYQNEGIAIVIPVSLLYGVVGVGAAVQTICRLHQESSKRGECQFPQVFTEPPQKS